MLITTKKSRLDNEALDHICFKNEGIETPVFYGIEFPKLKAAKIFSIENL